MRDCFVLPDRDTPLLAHAGPPAADLKTSLGQPGGTRRQRQPARVQRGQRDLQALAFLADQVLGWYPNVVKADDRVPQGLESHEARAVLDPDARPCGLDD